MKIGDWNTEEDRKMMTLYENYGTKWKKFLPDFISRSENSIKNRFYSNLRKTVTEIKLHYKRMKIDGEELTAEDKEQEDKANKVTGTLESLLCYFDLTKANLYKRDSNETEIH